MAELLHGETRVTPHLAAPPSGALLEEIPKEGRVALVGHEPYLSALLAWLLLGDLAGASALEGLGGRFPFKKGGWPGWRGTRYPGECSLGASFRPRSSAYEGLGPGWPIPKAF